MEDLAKYHGSLVAFEGPSDIVATQLRLLPNSPQILVLPGIQHYLNKVEIEEPFNARHFIHQVHTAATARHDAALKFLQKSAPEQKRVVFMNGGTIGAQALCISAISKNETDGDLTQADSVFNGLVRDGVTGLSKDITIWRNSIQMVEDDANMTSYLEDSEEPEDQEQAQDPISLAMRAADALDRKTESLQPVGQDLDLTACRLTRSLSLSVLDFNDKFQDTTPLFIFGTSSDSGSTAPTSVDTTPVKDVEISKALRKRPMRISIATSTCRSHAGELYDTSMHSPFSPVTDTFTSPPMSPDKVEFGEAQIVQMDSPTRRALRKIKSLDRIFLSNEHAGDSSSPPSLDFGLPSPTSTPTKAGKKHSQKQRPISCVGMTRSNADKRSSVRYLDIPKAVFVKANKTTITRSPTSSPASSLGKRRMRLRPSYVDKGVDAPVFLDLDEPEVENRGESPFEPVLPLVEDRVIHFKEESQSELLNLVIRGFKDGAYPVLARSDPSASDAPVGMPSTPTSQRSRSASDKNRISLGAVQNSEPAIVDTDEYDPYAPHGTYKLNNWMRKDAAQAIKITPLSDPSSEPASGKSESDKRFYTFSSAGRQTAVNAQNRLRSLLSTYFPAEDAGYRPFHSPLLPEMGSLWKPILRQMESSPALKSGNEKKIDLILAIGAQRWVKKEYSSAITGQIEKLGVKPSGLSRSGRLELRYFIATAMQTLAAQPLEHQTKENPLTNHTLLATLIVPHLETYLAVHSDVRFLLLEYSADHLPTVLALQKLVGSDVVKVAGILDGEDAEPMSPAHVRSRPSSRRTAGRERLDPSKLGAAAPASPVSSVQLSAQTSNQSFSKANFLLTSSATDSEIATFISTIWKILISISSYYIPEHVPRKVASHASIRKPGNNRVGAAISAIENTYTYPHEQSITSATPQVLITPSSESTPFPAVPALPPVSAASAVPVRPPSPAESLKSRVSVSTSIRSGRSGRSGRTWRTNASKSGRLRSLRSKRGRDKDSIYGWVDKEEDDEDYDLEVRRVMPMFVRRRDMHMQRGNSRKALKWLGLA